MKDKNNNFRIIFLLALSIIGLNYVVVAKDKAIIEGHFKVENKAADSVTFRIWKDFIYYRLNSETFTVICDKNGYAKASLPVYQKATTVAITVHGVKTKTLYDKIYSAGDSIIFNYPFSYKEKEIYSGLGSAKWNMISDLDYVLRSSEFSVLMEENERYRSKPFIRGFAQLQEDHRSQYVKKLVDSILEIYKPRVKIETYNLIAGDAKAHIAYVNLQALIFAFISAQNDRSAVLDSFQNALPYFENIVKDDKYCNTEERLRFALALSKAKIRFKNDYNKPEIKEIYDQIMKDHHGLLGQFVAANYLLSKPEGSGDEFSEALSDLSKQTENSTISKFINQRLFYDKPGTDLIDFAFQDSSGRVYTKQDFANKVVLLNFYFEGCGFCVYAAKILRENVIPNFLDNPNVEFVTINIDDDRSRWIRSLKSGLYTNERSINLWTNGEGFENSWIKNYNLSALPKYFLIDRNGKVINTNQSRMPEKINSSISSLLPN